MNNKLKPGYRHVPLSLKNVGMRYYAKEIEAIVFSIKILNKSIGRKCPFHADPSHFDWVKKAYELVEAEIDFSTPDVSPKIPLKSSSVSLNRGEVGLQQ